MSQTSDTPPNSDVLQSNCIVASQPDIQYYRAVFGNAEAFAARTQMRIDLKD